MDDMHHLSADELQAQIEAVNAKREALKAALHDRHEAEKTELAAEIKALISDARPRCRRDRRAAAGPRGRAQAPSAARRRQ